MPESYDVELSIDGEFQAGFNGEDALCNAVEYTRDNPLTPPAVYEIYDSATDQNWVGPRAGRP